MTSRRIAVAALALFACLAVSPPAARADALARANAAYARGDFIGAVNLGDSGFVAAPAGSPFLEGATVTVAGAALLQRVTRRRQNSAAACCRRRSICSVPRRRPAS